MEVRAGVVHSGSTCKAYKDDSKLEWGIMDHLYGSSSRIASELRL